MNHRPIALTTLALLAGGCGDLLKQPYPAKALFGLDPGTPAVSVATSPDAKADTYVNRDADVVTRTRPTDAGVMLVRPVRVSPPYDGLAFVYRDGPAAYTTDYYSNWVTSPSALLTGGLTDWLDRAGPMPVVATGSAVRPTAVLDVGVTRLLIDRTDRRRPKAVVAARAFVTRELANGGSSVASDASYVAEVPVQTDTPAGYAQAWGTAWGQVLRRLATDLRGGTGGMSPAVP